MRSSSYMWRQGFLLVDHLVACPEMQAVGGVCIQDQLSAGNHSGAAVSGLQKGGILLGHSVTRVYHGTSLPILPDPNCWCKRRDLEERNMERALEPEIQLTELRWNRHPVSCTAISSPSSWEIRRRLGVHSGTSTIYLLLAKVGGGRGGRLCRLSRGTREIVGMAKSLCPSIGITPEET